MKEVKSGERQKIRWQMRRMILIDINMPLNHIIEGRKYRHMYVVWSLTVTTLLCFTFHPTTLSPPSLTWPLCSFHLSFYSLVPIFLLPSCLSHCHPIIQCFPQDLTLWGYCVQKMILISAHSSELSCKVPFPHGDAAKRTGTNSLWHTIAWVLTEEGLVFAFQKEVIFSRLAMQNDIIIRWNLILQRPTNYSVKSLWVKLLFWRSVWCKEKCVWLRG